MLTGIRHTAVLVLGFVLAALVMTCGDTQPPTPKPSLSKAPATATAIPGPSQAKAAPTVKSTQQNAQDVPTPFPTSSPLPSVTRIPTSASTPIAPETQSTGLPEPEILYEFSGSGTGETALFDAGDGANILINYIGGPITVYWIERDDPPREIYDGPSSSNGKYDTNIAESGRYSIGIKCDDGCEWTVRIESVGGTTPIVFQVDSTPKTNNSGTGQASETSEAQDLAIFEEEWDVLSQSEASVILSAPNTRVITLGYDPGGRMASINGAKTSVPPNAHVMVANLELGNFVVVKADQDGKFQAEIDGHPGTHILIKQDTTGQIFNVEDPQSTHGPNTLRTIFPPGVLLRIPVKDSDTGVPFSSAGRLPSDEDAPWTIEGNLGQAELAPGQEIAISGQVAIRTDESNRPSTGQLRFKAYLLINANGRQVGGANNFVTSLFTATDLPIESKDLSKESYSVGTDQLNWRFEDELWVSDFSTTLTIREMSDLGLYQLKASLDGVEDLPRKGDPNILRRSFLQEASIGTVVVGAIAPMRLTSTLLADELSEGSRGGVVAREDQGLFDISHRAGVRHQPVLPRLDNYGHLWNYRLDPYVPMLGVVDRSPPAAPSIELDFSRSDLTITVSRPDGQIDVLGPAPLTRYTVKSPRTPWHRTVSEGGGNLGEIPQLQTDGDQFTYEFPADGDYVITLNGKITDLAGRVYAITGTYDVTIANVLDIETSLLPGTPFEVGNSLPIGLRVMPGLPAAITYKVKHIAPDGEITARTFSGKANQDGWWDGDGGFFKFQQDGEYRVDVEARHTDNANNMWIGRLTFGSAVATPEALVILHGRRGASGVSEIPTAWMLSNDITDPNADHMQLPYFSGDIIWGQNKGQLKDSVAFATSIQIIDDTHPLISRVREQADTVGTGISKEDLIKAGQLPFGTNIKPGLVGKVDGVDLWAYSYISAQRPGVRVREHVLGDDVGGPYWRFDDAYHMQSGNGRQGDLPGDFKFMYAAGVIRDATSGEGIYATYGSGWVMAFDDDPMGARVMPPFQGAAGGPNGGPLFTIHGREIDMFFLPLGIRPGAVLEIGESFRMAGPIMPTLPSHVEYIVTQPGGTQRNFQGRANNVGYFYQPEDDFVLDQAGLWTVELKVTHDGMTSAGPVEHPYPTGGPLTIDGSTFGFVVKGPDTRKLDIETSLSELSPAEWFSNVRTARFEATLPKDWSGDKARVIVTMPGIVLVDEEVPTNGATVTWNLDAEKLNQLANNFDYEQGIADTIDVTFYAQGILNGAPAQAVGAIVTHGARVPTTPEFVTTLAELPELSDFIANPTDQFLVDMVYVSGGHPFKGQGTKDPDNGAHVEFDNSGNQWPEGTVVTDFPAIYAVADGYVSKISTWEPVGGKNYKYDIWFVFAQKDGTPVRFLLSIEPSTNPGDASFYEPFIVVKEGQSVRKGDVLAYMYLEPNRDFPGPHIHFSVSPEQEEQQAPAIFTDELVEAFHNNWGIFGFDRENNVPPNESDTPMPPCMGYKLAANENPFAASASECLK